VHITPLENPLKTKRYIQIYAFQNDLQIYFHEIFVVVLSGDDENLKAGRLPSANRLC